MESKQVSGQGAHGSIELEVSLPSGRCETVVVSRSGTIVVLKVAICLKEEVLTPWQCFFQSNSYFGARFPEVCCPWHLLDLTEPVQLSGLRGGDSIIAVAQLPEIAAVRYAFSLWCVGGGSIVTWGDPDSGGDSSRVQAQLKNVRQICGAHWAFAAILADGSVVTWGQPDRGGDSSRVQDQLKNVQRICGTERAFAAILADGTVVTWGNPHFGGDSSRVQHQLINIRQISGKSTGSAFAAILADGSVVTWGDDDYGGDSSRVQAQLRNVQQICATDSAFAAILADGTVVTWGNRDNGGDSSRVQHDFLCRLYPDAEQNKADYSFLCIGRADLNPNCPWDPPSFSAARRSTPTHSAGGQIAGGTGWRFAAQIRDGQRSGPHGATVCPLNIEEAAQTIDVDLSHFVLPDILAPASPLEPCGAEPPRIMADDRSQWWSSFRNQHSARGFMLQAAKVVTSEALGLSSRLLKHREQGVTPQCSFSVTSIDTAVVDGIILRGSLLLPEGVEGPFPAVLLRTPYGRKAEMGQSVLAKQGYAVLVQDTRGRFSSSGEFVPVQHEQVDGEATVAWMRRQVWCNGKVGVTGVSYLGFTAWACVDGADVDAIVPMITQSNIRSAVFRPGGAISFELLVLWFYLVLHLMKDLSRDRLSFVRKLWQGMREGKLRRAFKSLPMGKVDEIILGSPNSFLQAGLVAHGDESDGFWEGKEKLCNFEKPIPPCHILSGWYDFFLEGALEDFQMAKQRGSHVSLTVGPTHHWSLLGFRQVFERTMLSCFDEHLKGDLRWHGQSLHGPHRSQNLSASAASSENGMRVHLYVMGLGWRHYPTYPPPARSSAWSLNSDFSLRAGNLLQKDLEHSYHYNPARPTPAAGGPSFNPLNTGAKDQAKIEARGDVLVYSSAPLTEALQIVGPVHLQLEATWQTETADFVGRLCHVGRDGRSTNLCEGLTNVKVCPKRGAPAKVEVAMGHTAVLFRAGERLRLQICSAAHPRWFRNLGVDEKLHVAARMKAGDVKPFGGT
eukprot:s596_g3.t1